MNFLNYEVWTQAGDVIQVFLTGNAANVLVLDEMNFQNYRSGKSFRYAGGYFTQSPALIKPPSAGHWHVVVDLGGGAGTVNAEVRILRKL